MTERIYYSVSAGVGMFMALEGFAMLTDRLPNYLSMGLPLFGAGMYMIGVVTHRFFNPPQE